MPHSLRAKIGGLRYKGILEDKDYKRLCKALDNENVLEQIRDEIEETIESYVCDKEENTMKAQGMLNAMQMTFDIIDKYKGNKE